MHKQLIRLKDLLPLRYLIIYYIPIIAKNEKKYKENKQICSNESSNQTIRLAFFIFFFVQQQSLPTFNDICWT